jgi:hypothetical protein
MATEAMSLVSGHDFSRAAKAHSNESGFSPCVIDFGEIVSSNEFFRNSPAYAASGLCLTSSKAMKRTATSARTIPAELYLLGICW